MAILERLFKGKKRVTPKPKHVKAKVKHRVVKKPKPIKKIKHRVKPKVKHKIIKKHIKKPITKKPVIKLKIPTIEKISDGKAYDIIKKYKIPIPKHFFSKKEKDIPFILKKIGFPCVMKVSGSIVHKTEVGGVKTNIMNEQQGLEAFKTLMKIKGCERVLIQKQVEGIELIVGAKYDPQFGAIVSVGIGGIYVEILKDVVFRVAPITINDAESMIRELKGYDILAGARGTKPINFNVLYDTLVKVSKLAVSERIKEMDINPLFCDDKGCYAADVRIVK